MDLQLSRVNLAFLLIALQPVILAKKLNKTHNHDLISVILRRLRIA